MYPMLSPLPFRGRLVGFLPGKKSMTFVANPGPADTVLCVPKDTDC